MGRAKNILGQHWLEDEKTLEAICDAAELNPGDMVLEIGPGHGSLTRQLVKRVKRVLAVELDPVLVAELPQTIPAGNLEVIQADILKLDLSNLPEGYKVVANIPYYLTSNLLRRLSESSNPPASMALLVQKEVAQRICAGAGRMSILSVSAQLYYKCELGQVVPAELFIPPPKVDSQVVSLSRHTPPLFPGLNPGNRASEHFFRIVKAGFSERRKKLRSSLAGGLRLPKEKIDNILSRSGISGDLRAQNLSLNDWYKIYQEIGPLLPST